VASSAATSLGYSTIRSEMAAFFGTFLNANTYTGSKTNDYSIVGQYVDSGGHTPTPSSGFAGDLLGVQTTLSTINDAGVRTYLKSLFNASTIPVVSNRIYGVYLPPGMQSTTQAGTQASCVNYCGYHSHFTYISPMSVSTQIKYAVFPYPSCGPCKLNALAVADMLTIVSSHEIRESATDPGNNNSYAFYDATGNEADDKCAWHNLYQMTRTAGLNFWVQPEYSNGGTVGSAVYPGPGCIVP
jgi:hypothetical protein